VGGESTGRATGRGGWPGAKESFQGGGVTRNGRSMIADDNRFLKVLSDLFFEVRL